MRWSSGLLALYAAGHIRHYVGVFANLDRHFAKENAERIAALFSTPYAAGYVSPQDGVKAIIDENAGRRTDKQDIKRRDDRDEARALWSYLPELMQEPFDDAWHSWLSTESLGVRPRFLRFALLAAKDPSFSYLERDLLVKDFLVQWLYTEIYPEPPLSRKHIFGAHCSKNHALIRLILHA